MGQSSWGFGIPSIEVASVCSTGAPLSGVDAAPASHSSWFGLEHRSLDCAKLWFEPAEGHWFGIPLLLLQLLLLDITVLRIVCFTLNSTLTGFTQYNNYYYECKGSKGSFNQKSLTPLWSVCFSTWNIWCLSHCGRQTPNVPPPLLQHIQLKEMVFFPDSGKHLRRC